MKSLLYLVLALVVIAGAISAFWWVAYDTPIDEQIEVIKASVGESVEDSAASNVSESASKLGKVLKGSFEEAQDVYQNGADR